MTRAFSLLVVLALALAAPALKFSDAVPPVKTPVTVSTGPEGISLDNALRSIAETAGLTYLSRDVPEKRVRLRLKGVPFIEAWTLLMRTYGDGLDDLTVNDRIVVVAPREVIERIKRVRPTTLAELAEAATAPHETVKVIPVRPIEGLDQVLKAFFPQLTLARLADPPAIVAKGNPEDIEALERFLRDSALALGGSLAEAVLGKEKTLFTAVFYVAARPSEAKPLLEALTSVAPEAKIAYVPAAQAIVARSTADRLVEIKATLEKLGVLITPKEAKALVAPGSLRVYDLGLGMEPAAATLEALVGNAGKVRYDKGSGLLFVYAPPALQARVEAAVQSIRAQVPSKKPVEVEPGTTLLYYRTTLKPSVVAKYLSQVLPEAGLVPMDENSLLLVRGAPAVQRKVALILKEIDRESPEAEAAKARARAKAEAERVLKATYRPSKTSASAAARALKAVLSPTLVALDKPQGQPAQPQGSGVQIVADPASNQVFLYGPKRIVDDALELAKTLDVPPAQAALRVWIEEVDRSAAGRLGIDWTFNTGKFVVGLVSGALEAGYDSTHTPLDALSAQLSLLEQTGRSRRLLDTTLLSVSGEPAAILSGGKLLLPTGGGGEGEQQGFEEFEYGLKLSVTPHIASKDSLVLDIEAQVGALPQAGPIPNSVQIPQSKTTSQIRLRPGVPVVLGGVIGNETTTTERGIPVLKDIPFIGALFKTTETTHTDRLLLIIVEAQVIKEAPATTLDRPEPRQPAGPVTKPKAPEGGFELPPLPWEERATRYREPVEE